LWILWLHSIFLWLFATHKMDGWMHIGDLFVQTGVIWSISINVNVILYYQSKLYFQYQLVRAKGSGSAKLLSKTNIHFNFNCNSFKWIFNAIIIFICLISLENEYWKEKHNVSRLTAIRIRKNNMITFY
jgi:hypothetical protein